MALDLSATAKKLIRNLAAKSEEGVFHFVYEAGGSVDPDTGQWTPGFEFRVPVDGARVQYSQSLIDGINIMTGDFMLLVPFDAPIPPEPFKVECESGLYAVVGVPEVNHAGKVQLYKIQLRRA